ncbi:MAG: adenine-specific methyltransferase EcoRI family protein [Bacteroidales bacterium]|nr:adenine-specific methyltransferase EcoRI family protein [Bacteroidales bacterium]
MANESLSKAKSAKNDEFYTQYYDIEREVEAYLDYNPDVFRGKTVLLPCDDPEWSNFTKYFAQNFERLGLRKLISTSYAIERKQERYGAQLSLFETEFETSSPHYDRKKTRSHGKIFILEQDENGDSLIDIDDLKWQYLKGDGDFRSAEVTRLRDEADIIVTNPPFSLFREFVAWLVCTDKNFIIIGNMNAISYKEVFPLIRDNKMWLGVSSGAKEYLKPGGEVQKMGNTCWFTNVDHGRRHQPLELMTMEDNIKYSRHKEVAGQHYIHYANYDAIEVPYADAIPSDYEGTMGVPLSFLFKYCPEQFTIIGQTQGDSGKELGLKPYPRELKKLNPSLRDGQLYYIKDMHPEKPYARILIRKKQ